jgi:transposase
MSRADENRRGGPMKTGHLRRWLVAPPCGVCGIRLGRRSSPPRSLSEKSHASCDRFPIKLESMAKTFRPYDLNQQLLLPPDLRAWLPDGHLALFISDVVDELDLSAIVRGYDGDERGQPPYHPTLMVKLLLYAYCTGRPSSRRIERATYEDVACRVLAADQHPDHDSIAAFRQRHLPALAMLFVQGLQLCRAAGLVTLGQVALDGTKVKAQASKHKAMSYARMGDTEARLEREVAALLARAQAVDAAEDAQYGRGRHGDELPAELARRENRLAKIRAAKAALEQEAREQAVTEADAVHARLAARAQGLTGRQGRAPVPPDPDAARPAPGAQRNFTDPDSRIMKDGATGSFEQAYNAQAAVDGQAQIIVAATVMQGAGDRPYLVPMLDVLHRNLDAWPTTVTADGGYFSEANLGALAATPIDLYVPPDRHRPGPRPINAPAGPEAEIMREKLATPAGQAVYRRRKSIVEPVFGQIKEVRGFRRFSFRGLARVTAEWSLICLTHNLLKLHRAQWATA